MKFVLPLVCVFLVVAYAAGVHYFYKDQFADDLGARAASLISATAGLEDVRVEFRAFDAFLSGNVPSSELRDRAASLVASLPAARVVSNGIAYPGFDPSAASRAADSELAANLPKTGPKASKPAPPKPKKKKPEPPVIPPPPPPKTPPNLNFVSTDTAVTLSGAVPDITTKSSFLRAIALSGRYLDVDGKDFDLDPELASLDWPDELPPFIAFLLTRTTDASLAINGVEVDVTATALDPVCREQVLSRLNAIEFPGRHLRIDISQAPELEIAPESFFFKATLAEGILTMHGRLDSPKKGDRFKKILKTDLPELQIAGDLKISEALEIPDWSTRLPNLLSLICTRTESARVSTNGAQLRVIAEMKPGNAPEDLADVVSLMTGPSVTLETRFLPFDEELAPKDTPSKSASTPPAKN